MKFRIWVVGYFKNNYSVDVAYFLFRRTARKYFKKMREESPNLKWYCGGEMVHI